MSNKVGRFFYLSYHVPKLFFDYSRMYDEKDTEKLKELGIHLRKELEELGPTFIKFGQMLSLRYDLLHPIICKELRKMLDGEKKVDFKEIRPILKKEYGPSFKKIFKFFDEKPLASASIAQVHKAKLKNGKDVIVKIRKPGVKEQFEKDIDILYFVAKTLSFNPKMKNLNLVGVIEEFSKWSKRELDFTMEGKNIERFKKNLSDFDFVVIPTVYWDHTRENILVTDYLEGITLNQAINAVENKDNKILDKMKKDKIDLKKFIKKYPKILFQQVFEDGFFNADPHPANIVLLPNNKIGLIDFGMVDELSEMELSHLFIAILSFVDRDIDSLTELVIKIGKSEKENIDVNLIKKKVNEAMKEIYKGSIDEIDSTEFFHKLLSIFYHSGLKVPSEFTALGKEFAILDGVADIIAPDFDLMKELKPICSKMLKKEIKKKFTTRKLLKSVSKLLETTGKLPETIAGVLGGLKHGKFQVNINTEVSETKNKKNDNSLKIIMLILLSLSMSLFISIGGNLKTFNTGLKLDKILIWFILFPFIFVSLYLLSRKKLNL